MTTMDARLERRPFLERPLLETLSLDWEKMLYAILILAAIVTRFYMLGARVMSHDESLHTYFAYNLFQGKGFQHTPLMHGPLKFHLAALSYWLLGDSDFSARVPTAVFGVAAVVLPMFLHKWLGRTGALATSLLVLISPFMMYYSRYIRDEPIVVVWVMLMALITFSYVEKRDGRWLVGLAAVTALFYTTMESSFIYVAIWLLFLGLYILRDVTAMAWPRPEYKRIFLVCVAGAGLAVLATGTFFYLSRNPQLLNPNLTAEPLAPQDENTHQIGLPPSPFNTGIAVAGGIAAFFVVAGTAVFLLAFGQEARRFPALDLIVILWTFVMPQLTAFPVAWFGHDPLDYSFQGALFTATFLVPILLVSAAIGLVWNWRKWLVCAGIFYGIYFVFFTTVFTNGNGWATGMIGSLGYWLAQQGVRRGNQPPYYYVLVQIPIYEFLPALGALGAMIYGLIRWIRAEDVPAESSVVPSGDVEALSGDENVAPPDNFGAPDNVAAPDGRDASSGRDAVRREGFPAIPFLAFWSVAGVVAFSIAGEKMPWLTTHITLPFILL
ncbi:MAG: TIGR03663 family protein, partial [Chloroflexi bacterium]|nr:TIGR03663 family protein [Chloroflexota bacterium]